MSLVASRRCSILLWIEFTPSSLMCYIIIIIIIISTYHLNEDNGNACLQLSDTPHI